MGFHTSAVLHIVKPVTFLFSKQNRKTILSYCIGKLVFLYLKLINRRLAQELNSLADYLERQLFPILRESNKELIYLRCTFNSETPVLSGSDGSLDFSFPDTTTIAHSMNRFGFKEVQLGTNLESGQIAEAVLLLTYVYTGSLFSRLAGWISSDWRRQEIRHHMTDSTGYSKFCALMYMDETKGCYRVTYHYCELFFSRTIRGYLRRNAFYKDHRGIEQVKPVILVFTILLMLLPGVIRVWSFPGSLAVEAVFMMGCVFIIWYLFKTLIAIQYDREHYESLTNQYVKQVSLLSRFPESNPQPVMRFDLDGNSMYLNPAVKVMLLELGGQPDDFQLILPPDYRSIIQHCAQQNKTKFVENTVGSSTLNYLFNPYPDLHSVIVYGNDVTALKMKEQLLKNLSQNLSEIVKAKTKSIQRTQNVTIFSLAKLAETRDPETGKHLERTQRYVKMLAVYMQQHSRYGNQLTDQLIESIYCSAPLHDIGKVGVPDGILLKPGKLTEKEYDEMKKHTLYGGNALQESERMLGFDSFLRVAKEIAFHHHERWDGKGYPFGKKEEDIPLPARLMSVADVYDALISRRPYKEPFPHEKAREIIIEGRGTQFDPFVVDAFLSLEDQFQQTAKAYAEPELEEEPMLRVQAN